MEQNSAEQSMEAMDRPNVARVYDYMLGGVHHSAVDRAAAEKLLELDPNIRKYARTGRSLLARIVTYLANQGIDQFLDIGSGLPSMGNVHEIAREINPEVRVVYVDNDAIAVALSEKIIMEQGVAEHVVAIEGDAHHPPDILAHEDITRLLDFDRPVAVLFLMLLHFFTDDSETQDIVHTFRDALVPGSYLAISQFTPDIHQMDELREATERYQQTISAVRARSVDELAVFFEGFDLVEPGIVHFPAWRPAGAHEPFFADPTRFPGICGVGRKM